MTLVNRDCLSVMEDASGRLSALVVSSDEDRETFRTDVLEYASFEADPETVFTDDLWITQMWKAGSGRHFLCGALGTVLWQKGKTFRRAALEATQLYGIWGLAENAVYTVGAKGRCFRFDGTKWIAMHLPGGTDLGAVHGRSESDVVVVGDDGLVARWDGSAWRVLDLPISDRLRGTHVTPEISPRVVDDGLIRRRPSSSSSPGSSSSFSSSSRAVSGLMRARRRVRRVRHLGSGRQRGRAAASRVR